MEDLAEFGEQLGVEFQDFSLLSRALTHRSYLNENPGSVLEDNERLEYLGDADVYKRQGGDLPAAGEGGVVEVRR